MTIVEDPTARLLIIIVGGSNEPLVASVLADPRPSQVVFICSPETHPERPSREGEPTLLSALEVGGFSTVLNENGWIVDVGDAQDLHCCVQRIESLTTPVVQRFLAQSPRGEIVVDITGGTKTMSSALALVARRWHCSFRYVGGDFRTKGGVGQVETGSEKIFAFFNPLEALGYQVADEALTLAKQWEFAAAYLVINQRLPGPHVQVAPGLRSLRLLLEAFREWDRFRHESAANKLKQFRDGEHLERLESVLHNDSIKMIEAEAPAWELRLKALTMAGQSKQPSAALVADLLANAQRRIDQERPDDAVGRLYRSVEAIAQVRLLEGYGIATDRVLPSQMPASFIEDRKTQPGLSQAYKLGLQDAYALLRAKGDPLGQQFDNLGLSGKQSPLNSRNTSILAHGFTALGLDFAQRLAQKAMSLAELIGVPKEDILQFPRLLPRSVL